jgi:hypothetical protein
MLTIPFQKPKLAVPSANKPVSALHELVPARGVTPNRFYASSAKARNSCTTSKALRAARADDDQVPDKPTCTPSSGFMLMVNARAMCQAAEVRRSLRDEYYRLVVLMQCRRRSRRSHDLSRCLRRRAWTSRPGRPCRRSPSLARFKLMHARSCCLRGGATPTPHVPAALARLNITVLARLTLDRVHFSCSPVCSSRAPVIPSSLCIHSSLLIMFS